jgi:hypothetical protein
VPALNTCSELLERILVSSHVVGNSPRSICLSRNGRDCCISWDTNLGDIHESAFYNAAKKSMDTCVTEGRSGRARDVFLNGKCLEQCLSDRATGC